jgi:hypothetical protein
MVIAMHFKAAAVVRSSQIVSRLICRAIGVTLAAQLAVPANALCDSNSTLSCDRQMRKTAEGLQAWRRTHTGRYPSRLSDLPEAMLIPPQGGICPEILKEALRADPSHHWATSRASGGDPIPSYEYELSGTVAKSRSDALWLPSGTRPYTRQDLKVELLRRPFYEQIPILRCNTHRAAANGTPDDNSGWRNLTVQGNVYPSGDLWEQRWLSDVPYCCREVNVLFGLKGPAFTSGRRPGCASALDLRQWVCAFGDHAWWWTFPMFDEGANKQNTPQLHPFFRDDPGRVALLAQKEWWIDGLVQLQGRILTQKKNVYREPGLLAFVWERTALPVNRKFAKATWLQGTIWAAPTNDTAGWLVWHYSNGSTERAPITYGQTTARFWGDLQQITREQNFPEPVWKHHETAQEVGIERWLRLYEQSWDNPHPELTVTTLDFVSNRDSPAAPFIVAINVYP